MVDFCSLYTIGLVPGKIQSGVYICIQIDMVAKYWSSGLFYGINVQQKIRHYNIYNDTLRTLIDIPEAVS